MFEVDLLDTVDIAAAAYDDGDCFCCNSDESYDSEGDDDDDDEDDDEEDDDEEDDDSAEPQLPSSFKFSSTLSVLVSTSMTVTAEALESVESESVEALLFPVKKDELLSAAEPRALLFSSSSALRRMQAGQLSA